MDSKHLSEKQILALRKLGDAMIPAEGELPGFSASGCYGQVDRILDYMPEQDRSDLGMLLTIFSFIPSFGVRLVLAFLEFVAHFPTALGGGVLRLIRLGLRGLVMSLYYGDGRVLDVLGYQVGVFTEDQKKHLPSPR